MGFERRLERGGRGGVLSWWAAFWCWEKRLLSEGFRGLKLENVVNAAVDGEVMLS